MRTSVNRPRHPRRTSVHRRSTLVGGLVVVLVAAAACVPPPPEPIAAVQMDPGAIGAFFSMPWPNDVRRAADGTLDLAGLPGVDLLPGESPNPIRSRFPGIVAEIGRSLTGFGVNTAAYFGADLPLDPASVPAPSASTSPGSPVLLMDLDHPGERVPVIVDVQQAADRNRPSDIITVLPYPGHPLRQSTRYAVALLDGLRLQSGQRLLPAPLVARLDEPWTADTGVDAATWDALRGQRDDVRAALASTTSWDPSHLVAFTEFTTQDVRGDLHAVADAVHESAPPAVQVLDQQPCAPDSRAGGRPTAALRGTVALTRWQAGTYPYDEAGGEIVVGTDGRAVPQGTFDAEFTARVPCGDPPPGGWPLLTFIDGTGGTYDLGATILPLTYEGYLIAEIAPVYGQGRGIVVTPLMQQLGITTASAASQFTFYNFFNPDAARTNTIQQTGENLQLLDAMEHLSLDGSTLGTSGTVHTDPTREVAAGQSQGAQTLPMVASVRPSLAGVVASAGSGGLYHTISHVKGNRDLLGALSGDAAALDELNPVVQVAQTMLEGGDGINFPSTVDYLNYDGREDTCVPFDTSRYFAGATGLPIAYSDPPASIYGDPAVDPPTVVLPARGNVAGHTRVSVERPGQHYVAYDQIGVTASFLADIAAGVVPTVPASGYSFGPNSSLPCGTVRWDVPPTRFGR